MLSRHRENGACFFCRDLLGVIAQIPLALSGGRLVPWLGDEVRLLDFPL